MDGEQIGQTFNSNEESNGIMEMAHYYASNVGNMSVCNGKDFAVERYSVRQVVCVRWIHNIYHVVYEIADNFYLLNFILGTVMLVCGPRFLSRSVGRNKNWM